MMEKIKQLVIKIFSFKRANYVWLGLLLVVCLMVASPAKASVFGWLGDQVLIAIGLIVSLVVSIISKLTVQVVDVLISVAQYNGFINAAPVRMAWNIIRDLCNMFFILLLLIMAFSTILQQKKYTMQSMLVRVVIAAIMINFSKLICAIIIDAAQVVMLTFVAGFQDIGGGNMINLLGVNELVNINTEEITNSQDVSIWYIAGAYILAVLYALVSLVVMVAMLVMLVVRVVNIWIYVILSPFAYFFSVLPTKSSYGSTWWKKFTSEVISGPVLAFFIWLSVASLGEFSGDDNAKFNEAAGFTTKPDDQTDTQLTKASISITKVGTADHLLRFVISLAFLIAGMGVTKSVGGMSGRYAGRTFDKLKNKGKQYGRSAGRWTKEKAKEGAKAGAAIGIGLAKGIDTAIAKGVNPNREMGFVTQGAMMARQNVFSADAWKKHAQTLTRAVGWEKNALVNKERYRASVTGEYKDANGAKYKYDANIGRYTKRDAEGGVVMENGKPVVAKVNGVELTKMSNLGQGMYEGYNSSKRILQKKATALSESDKKIEKLKDQYKGFSQSELLGMRKVTGNKDSRMAMYMAAVDQGALPKDLAEETHASAQADFSHNPGLWTKIHDKTSEKQAFLNYDMNDAGDVAAMQEGIKKGKYKLEDQDFGKISDEQRGQYLKDAYLPAMGADALQKVFAGLENKKELKKLQELIDAVKASNKKSIGQEYNKGYDQAMIGKDPNNATHQAEAQAAGLRAIMESKDFKDFNNVLASATGNLNEAFKFKVNINGTQRGFTDIGGASNFVRNSNAKTLAKLDDTSINNFSDILASELNFRQVQAIAKEDPAKAEKYAKIMADGNHPDSTKLKQQFFNVTVDAKAAKKNGALRDVFSSSGERPLNSVVEDFRKHLDDLVDKEKTRLENDRDAKIMAGVPDVNQVMRDYDKKIADAEKKYYSYAGKQNKKGPATLDDLAKDNAMIELKRFISRKFASNRAGTPPPGGGGYRTYASPGGTTPGNP